MSIWLNREDLLQYIHLQYAHFRFHNHTSKSISKTLLCLDTSFFNSCMTTKCSKRKHILNILLLPFNFVNSLGVGNINPMCVSIHRHFIQSQFHAIIYWYYNNCHARILIAGWNATEFGYLLVLDRSFKSVSITLKNSTNVCSHSHKCDAAPNTYTHRHTNLSSKKWLENVMYY